MGVPLQAEPLGLTWAVKQERQLMPGQDWPCLSQQGTWVVVEEYDWGTGLCLRELVGTTVLSAASTQGCQGEPPLCKGSLACQSSGVSQVDSKAIAPFPQRLGPC